MTIDYGTDLAMVRTSAGLDLDTKMRLEPDTETLLLNAIIRRLSTPRGSIPEYPSYGYDLRSLLGKTLTNAQLLQEQAAIAAQLEQDERIRRARCSLSLSSTTGTLTATIVAVLETGETFTRVLSVSAVTISIIEPQSTA